jgi:small-conductance mechanosensitive channel
VLIAIVCLIGWAAITALNIGADLYLRQFRLDVEGNLMARKHNTQVRVLLRTAGALVVIITLGAALMTFEPVRQYGVSLLASAGVAGIVAGLAARPVLSNLFGGVQLAMTQPIRIDDSVVVEHEGARSRRLPRLTLSCGCGTGLCRCPISSRSRSRTGRAILQR